MVKASHTLTSRDAFYLASNSVSNYPPTKLQITFFSPRITTTARIRMESRRITVLVSFIFLYRSTYCDIILMIQKVMNATTSIVNRVATAI